ncbi:MAG: NYN domain-containing protein [bacterium]|nr:NYN domain-containing protein [bacterium]
MEDYYIYINKFKKSATGKVVVFIDAANLEHSVRDMWVNPKDIPDELKNYTTDELCWRIDYKNFRKFFADNCDLRTIRFYSANFRTVSHNKFLTFLRKSLEFKLETKFLKEYEDHTNEKPHRKANFDVEISVDATYAIEQYGTFILFSGDCDFEYLLKFLRGKNRVTIVFSRTGHIAKELPPAANYYFDIADFRHRFLRIEARNNPKAKNPA